MGDSGRLLFFSMSSEVILSRRPRALVSVGFLDIPVWLTLMAEPVPSMALVVFAVSF